MYAAICTLFDMAFRCMSRELCLCTHRLNYIGAYIVLCVLIFLCKFIEFLYTVLLYVTHFCKISGLEINLNIYMYLIVSNLLSLFTSSEKNSLSKQITIGYI